MRIETAHPAIHTAAHITARAALHTEYSCSSWLLYGLVYAIQQVIRNAAAHIAVRSFDCRRFNCFGKSFRRLRAPQLGSPMGKDIPWPRLLRYGLEAFMSTVFPIGYLRRSGIFRCMSSSREHLSCSHSSYLALRFVNVFKHRDILPKASCYVSATLPVVWKGIAWRFFTMLWISLAKYFLSARNEMSWWLLCVSVLCSSNFPFEFVLAVFCVSHWGHGRIGNWLYIRFLEKWCDQSHERLPRLDTSSENTWLASMHKLSIFFYRPFWRDIIF